MPFRWNPREHVALGRYAAKWLLIGVPVGAVVGSAVAGFLWLLERATDVRFRTDGPTGVPWLLYLLPAGGVGVGLLYHRFGKSVEGGNNLIMEQVHEPGGGVPGRMAPLVLAGTVLTHLFGGSAGREGTAVQMGGSLAAVVGRWLRLDATDTATLLMAGIAAGFGAVFGTPLTGALFALEVLAVGLVRLPGAGAVPDRQRRRRLLHPRLGHPPHGLPHRGARPGAADQPGAGARLVAPGQGRPGVGRVRAGQRPVRRADPRPAPGRSAGPCPCRTCGRRSGPSSSSVSPSPSGPTTWAWA